jgi:hypothetical protein
MSFSQNRFPLLWDMLYGARDGTVKGAGMALQAMGC